MGSTTVKAVVLDALSDRLLWSDYQRHDTRQPETVLAFLKRFDIEIAVSIPMSPRFHNRLGRERDRRAIGRQICAGG